MTAWRTTLRVLKDALLLALTCGMIPLWIAARTLALVVGGPVHPA